MHQFENTSENEDRQRLQPQQVLMIPRPQKSHSARTLNCSQTLLISGHLNYFQETLCTSLEEPSISRVGHREAQVTDYKMSTSNFLKLELLSAFINIIKVYY